MPLLSKSSWCSRRLRLLVVTEAPSASELLFQSAFGHPTFSWRAVQQHPRHNPPRICLVPSRSSQPSHSKVTLYAARTAPQKKNVGLTSSMLLCVQNCFDVHCIQARPSCCNVANAGWQLQYLLLSNAPLQCQMRHLSPPNHDGHHSTSHPSLSKDMASVPAASAAGDPTRTAVALLGSLVALLVPLMAHLVSSVALLGIVSGHSWDRLEGTAPLASPRTVARTSVPPSLSSGSS